MSVPRPGGQQGEVVSLGCRLNLAESERLRSMNIAGLVIVNSCSVTNEAVRQTRQAIRKARRRNPDARLIVTGCAAQTERAELAAMPEVDGLVANGAKLDPRSYNVPESKMSKSPGRTRAFIGVQTGCDHACTFCSIPQGRGPSRSLDISAVRREVARALEAGAKEVVLAGVDLTGWGGDLPGQPALGTLVAALLGSFPDLGRLRLSSLDGVEIDPKLRELLACEPRIMPHIHLSLQHGADLILKRMKRRHSRSDAIGLVSALRARRPDISVGADLIAGFPTEAEGHHAHNLSIIGELGITHGHVFPYSPRAETPAARMPQLPGATVKRRAAELRAACAKERLTWLHTQIGRPARVLVERGGRGYTENYAPVRVPTASVPGSIVNLTPQSLDPHTELLV
jgi:threonylcarbamoyladenosine tRNA methylthiotransferase MtaB